jgi:hypothetical protein
MTKLLKFSSLAHSTIFIPSSMRALFKQSYATEKHAVEEKSHCLVTLGRLIIQVAGHRYFLKQLNHCAHFFYLCKIERPGMRTS